MSTSKMFSMVTLVTIYVGLHLYMFKEIPDTTHNIKDLIFI